MKKVKIHQKIIINFVAFILLPIVLASLVIFHYYGVILQEKVGNSIQQYLTETSGNIGFIIDSSIAASSIVSMDQKLADNMKYVSDGTDGWKGYESIRFVFDRIHEVQNANLINFNGELSVMDFSGYFYTDESVRNSKSEYEALSKTEWFRKVKELNGFILWDKQEPWTSGGNSTKSETLTMSRLIKGYKTKGGYGILTITLPENAIWDIVNQGNASKYGVTVLLDSDYSILTADSQDYDAGIFRQDSLKAVLESEDNSQVTFSYGGEKTFINFRHIPKTGWIIANLMSYKSVMYEVNNLKFKTNLFYLAITAVLVLLTIYISRRISDPIMNLKRHMQIVQNGDFSTRIEIGGYEEIERLGESFNMMVSKIDDLIRQVEEATRKKQKANIEALQAQINPHFLFNTLNSIRWMASISGNENVSCMLSDLGKLLEGSIYKSDELISLKEEIDYLYSYVALQKMRFGDSFSMQVGLTEEILSCTIPKFILQPIVENSIIHGVSNMNGGLITVSGHLAENTAVIKIEDNGVGIGKQQLSVILTEENSHKGRLSKIGLKNVNERLKLVFGDKYGLTVENGKECGTIVSVMIPDDIDQQDIDEIHMESVDNT